MFSFLKLCGPAATPRTACYAILMYLGWPNWHKRFEPQDLQSSNFAGEAAFLLSI